MVAYYLYNKSKSNFLANLGWNQAPYRFQFVFPSSAPNYINVNQIALINQIYAKVMKHPIFYPVWINSYTHPSVIKILNPRQHQPPYLIQYYYFPLLVVLFKAIQIQNQVV